ncbi:glycosyltransferase family 2 protein [Culicoidibacter larvae]|uniref:glycosyltransferase family 2 protein n=1 Tax=Culicoidibacter larvae TaxID=2579976 RepID=UPI001484D4AA|nr:glycosyltransferase [Culicoidibacter larvae]
MSKVSVIVPVYNVENFLEKCLNSLVEQSFDDYEIICVNDGSTDNSANILDSYIEKYPSKVQVINQENAGLSSARNTGIRNSNSDWYMFVDSDDWVAPDFIEKLYLSVIDNNVKLAKCNIIFVEENKEFAFYNLNTGMYSTKFLLSNLQPSVWNGIYHKSLFNDVVFPQGLLYEDLAVFPLVSAQQDDFFYLDSGLYFYNRTNVNSIMNTVSPRVFQMVDSFNWLIANAKVQGIYTLFHDEIEFLAVRHIFIYHLDVIRGNFNKVEIRNQLARIAEVFATEFPNAVDNKYVRELLPRKVQRWALKRLVPSDGKSIIWYWRYLKIHG